MGIIARTKYGDCSVCSARDTNVVKRGKDLVCLNCKKNIDTTKQIANANQKQKLRGLIKYERQEGLIPPGTAELQRWFETRHKEMTGVCQHCGGKTEKDRNTYKCSIAHILPKSHFKSVATHPLNWIELCFYGKSCHTNYDNLMLDIMEMNCFDTIITRFVAMYPSIAEHEKRRIPTVLLQYVETEK